MIAIQTSERQSHDQAIPVASQIASLSYTQQKQMCAGIYYSSGIWLKLIIIIHKILTCSPAGFHAAAANTKLQSGGNLKRCSDLGKQEDPLFKPKWRAKQEIPGRVFNLHSRN